MRGVLVACGIAALALSAAPTAGPVVAIEWAGTPGSAQSDEALVKRARTIHDRVLTLDTHDDINPDNFTPERNYTAGSADAGQPAEDGQGRPGCSVLHRLRRPGPAHP